MSKFDGLLSVKTKQESNKAAKTAPEVVSAQRNSKLKSPGKRSDPSYTQITAYIRKETHESVMRQIYKRQEFSELIEELLTDWMKKAK
ncbi:MAG TPA: hypothetical protein VGC97_19200 [Pyrinomonadaceae bacterium]|jgi:hypothetical protein